MFSTILFFLSFSFSFFFGLCCDTLFVLIAFVFFILEVGLSASGKECEIQGNMYSGSILDICYIFFGYI